MTCGQVFLDGHKSIAAMNFVSQLKLHSVGNTLSECSFFQQNRVYIKTSKMVWKIVTAHSQAIYFTKFLIRFLNCSVQDYTSLIKYSVTWIIHGTFLNIKWITV